MRFCSLVPLLLLLAGCASPPQELLPESDAHAVMDPDRDVYVQLDDGTEVRASAMDGAEDSEALSPDGRWIAFVGGDTGIASVWVAEVPKPGQEPVAPIQLTNVGIEHQRRAPGQPPAGFVPPPDHAPLRWLDDRTIAWTAGGVEHTVEVPK
jgi:hypothetical protein